MARVMRLGWSPLPGAPDAYLSSIAHDDAAEAGVAALAVPAGTYDAVDDAPLTRRDLLAAMAAAFGLRPPRPLPAWATPLVGPVGALLARSQRISNRTLRAASGWAPRWPSAREGFRALAPVLGRGLPVEDASVDGALPRPSAG